MSGSTTLSCSDMTSEKSFHNASLSELLETAQGVANDAIEKTTVFDPIVEAEIPRFDLSELVLGRVLGRGGFCVVHEITSIKVGGGGGSKSKQMMRSISLVRAGSRRKLKKLHNRDDVSEGNLSLPGQAATRESVAAKCQRKGKPRYVVKQLPSSRVGNNVALLKGTVDLALETKFLATLAHPHIIKLVGTSQSGPFEEGYFIVLEKLQETLTKKFKAWTIVDRASRGITGSLTGGKKKKVQLMVERLRVAHDIANALGYLHGLSIIYRDLKPDNVGFDVKGKVTIFDFGLAKQLCKQERVADDTYRMTGFTGAIRYMAPEVGLGKPYNLSADVYSFGMLLWFIMALEPPFGCYTPDMLPKRVFEKGHRPVMLIEWNEDLCALIKSCWHANPEKRPDFLAIQENLMQQIHGVDPETGILTQEDGSTKTTSSTTTNPSVTSSATTTGSERKHKIVAARVA